MFEAIDTIVAALMKALGDTALLPLLPRLRLVGTIRLGCVVSSGLSAFPVEREQGIRSCEVPVYFTGGSRL